MTIVTRRPYPPSVLSTIPMEGLAKPKKAPPADRAPAVGKTKAANKVPRKTAKQGRAKPATTRRK